MRRVLLLEVQQQVYQCIQPSLFIVSFGDLISQKYNFSFLLLGRQTLILVILINDKIKKIKDILKGL